MSLTSTVIRTADATPASRNRVVDLLRVGAVTVVVAGHWLMAAVYLDGDGVLRRTDLLQVAAWTHPLTWVLQVMPVFFLVGGYSNARSWRSARHDGTPYGGWLRARLRRLTIPVLPLMLFWAVAAPAAVAAGMSTEWLRIASMASLVPTWFLAAYVVVVALTPLTLRCWERAGWWSLLVGLVGAGVVDWLSIAAGQPLVGFLNYALVWGSVHQVGYAWVDGALTGAVRRVLLGLVGLLGLLALVRFGPYAISMVGLEGHGVNNAYPTRVTLAFLGLLQAGVLLALEPLLARVAAARPVWLATVFVSARIMTVYLWHLTALGIVVAGALLAGGAGLEAVPGSREWWLARPAWFLALGLVTAALVAAAGRVEQPSRDPRPAPPMILPLAALVVTCVALGAMADLGIVSAAGAVHWYLPLVPVLACYAGGVTRLPGRLAS